MKKKRSIKLSAINVLTFPVHFIIKTPDAKFK